MFFNNLYGLVLLVFSCTFVKCEIPRVHITGAYDYNNRVSNFTCSVEYKASDKEWNPVGNASLIVKYNNVEKEHVAFGKLENVTFINTLNPVSQDREVFCRSLFYNNGSSQNVYFVSDTVIVKKVIQKTNEKTENITGHVTLTANKSDSFLNIGDNIYYTCVSSNFTVTTKLSAFQRNNKDMLERQLAASRNTSSLTFMYNVNATDHCTEIFCRARTDDNLNVLSTAVQVKINGVVGECGSLKEHVTPALVWYIVAGIVAFALVLVGVLYGLRNKE